MVEEPAGPAAGGAENAGAAEPIPSDERMGTLIFSAFLTALGLYWIYASSDLPSRQQTAHLSQGFLPTTAGILLAVLSAMLFVATWRQPSKSPEALGRPRLFEGKSELRGAAIFATLLAYIIALPFVHYVVSTFLLIVVGLLIAREPLRPKLFIIAAAITGVFYSIFVWALQIALPGSIFG